MVQATRWLLDASKLTDLIVLYEEKKAAEALLADSVASFCSTEVNKPMRGVQTVRVAVFPVRSGIYSLSRPNGL